MKTLSCLLLCLICYACADSNTSSKHELLLDGSRIDLELPSQFKEYNSEALSGLIQKKKSMNEIMALESYRSMLQSDERLRIFIDTSNVLNNIQMVAGHNIPMTKNTAQMLSTITRDDLYLKTRSMGAKLDILETSVNKGQHQYIKLKYAIEMEDDTLYQTNYVLKGPERSLGLILANDGQEDLEEKIRQFRFIQQ
ncbi:hypothetical protein [Robertkochia aurantiaca]|uniref:hypothetical protein n=1 Tax=Robertkochia aurantiaca TaxID=2873700 RepID=UPI001CC95F66|nr:hypothetical protein [Robertkochia sp. 3YJGBD-33]